MKRILAAILLAAFCMALMPMQVVPVSAAEPTSPGLLQGLNISVMGDSISTYAGWSDNVVLTDPSCTHRYGEAYYGPVGGDYHNTELLVTDTWWHQAATELGAEILVSNASNSTGLFSVPDWSSSAYDDWELWLHEFLAWKSRPYYMGKDGVAPDIIALYIGSNEAGRTPIDQMGSVNDVDFAALIKDNGDGTFTYKEPATVAEAYCILLHKLSVTYPKAEIYCFTAVPSAGGNAATGNTRMARAIAFNEMVRGVAAHHNAILVDLYEEFDIDPNGDGVVTEADWNEFKTYYNNDPHPNAAGFDVITRCFVNAVKDNSKYYAASVQTKASLTEKVSVSVTEALQSGKKIVTSAATDFVTQSGMIVDYESRSELLGEGAGAEVAFEDSYTSEAADGTYVAMGGSEKQTELGEMPQLAAPIPLTDKDDASTPADETQGVATGAAEGVTSVTGDVREGENDGVYDYTESGISRSAKLFVRTLDVDFSVGVERLYRHMNYVSNHATPTGTNGLMVVTPLKLPQSAAEVPAIAPGYDMVYLGSDILSHYWAAFAWNKIVPEDMAWDAEVPFYTDDVVELYVGAARNAFAGRNLLLPTLRMKHATVSSPDKFQARYSSVQQYTFSDAEGQMMTTYCADQFVSPVQGYSYRCVNLEDSTYYSHQEARMLRTVMNNGYWGSESGWGSLAAMKQMMTESGQFTQAEVDMLTDGMALTATQYAIWNFANFDDNVEYLGVYYFAKPKDTKATGTVDDATADLIMKLYHYLISLAPTMPSMRLRSTTQGTIINEHNFLESADITITGKPMDHPNNLDDDDTNDVYTADVSFTLLVTPSEERGDDLVMHLTGVGSNPIVGRIVGALQAGELDLEADANDENKYTFRGLQLQEGQHELGFEMLGSQVLDKTPHLLISEKRSADDEGSQTMVGLCEGRRSVGVSMDIVFEVNADDPLYFTRHIWRVEIPRINPPTGVDVASRRRKKLSADEASAAGNI